MSTSAARQPHPDCLTVCLSSFSPHPHVLCPVPLPRMERDGPLLACYRPLLFYAVTEALAVWTHAKLSRMGYTTLTTTDSCTYYTKKGGC
jgi:hypothetical protein